MPTSPPAEWAESRGFFQPPPETVLRPYQREAVTRVFEQLAIGRSTLVVMATGLGKTTVFGDVAGRWRGRVLVLAHREELLDQARRRLEAMTSERVGLEQADYWAAGERIVVGSVQTLCRARRRERFLSRPFDLVIVDEAHHTTARSYRAILDAFPGAKVLGVTATPDRGDGAALGELFESVAYKRDIEEGIDDGYLVPVSVRRWVLEGVDLSRVKTTAGDLNLGELDAEMLKANEAVAKATLELAGDRRTIVFTTTVQTAHDLCAHFNKEAGRRLAVAVDGKTPTDERREILAAHARGDVQVLVNVGIATEGYDCPAVSCVAVARPTKSRALYTQMAGRGLRVQPGLVEREADPQNRRALIATSGKPDCLLLDFSGNAGRHALVSPLDILGGRVTDDEDVRKRARKLVEKNTMGAKEAHDLARDQIARERAAREAAIRSVRSQVRGRAEEVDPFRADGASGGLPWSGPAPTAGQLEFLRRMKYPDKDLARMNRLDASRAIAREKTRRQQHLATFAQVRLLQRTGVRDADRLTMAQASAVIDRLKANNWRIAPGLLDAVLSAGREPGAEG